MKIKNEKEKYKNRFNKTRAILIFLSVYILINTIIKINIITPILSIFSLIWLIYDNITHKEWE